MTPESFHDIVPEPQGLLAVLDRLCHFAYHHPRAATLIAVFLVIFTPFLVGVFIGAEFF